MNNELIQLFKTRAQIKKKYRFLVNQLTEILDRKDQYKFKHLLRNPDKKLYNFMEENFEYRHVELIKKYNERIQEIDKLINPNLKDVETMMYVECLAFDEELRNYFNARRINYLSNLDDKCLHIKIGSKYCNTSLIYDKTTSTDYVNLYKIIFEYSWIKEHKGLSEHLLSRIEDMKENDYHI